MVSCTATVADLLAGLLPAAPFAATKSPLGILLYARLAATKGQVRVHTTDLQMSYSGPLSGASATEEGALLVPVAALLALLKTLPLEATARLDRLPAGALRLRTPTGRYTLPSEDPQHFPEPPARPPTAQPFQVDAGVLADVLQAVTYAASDDITRPVLTNVSLDGIPGIVEATATDGHRLAYARRLAPGSTPPRVLLPVPAARALTLWLAAQPEALVSGDVSERSATWTLGAATITTLLTQGTFPDLRHVIPALQPPAVTLPIAALKESLQRGLLFRGTEHVLSCQLLVGDDHLYLAYEHTGDPVARETLPAVVGTPGAYLQVKARLLLDALTALARHETTVHLSSKDPLSPLCLRGDEDQESLALVMPQRPGETPSPADWEEGAC